MSKGIPKKDRYLFSNNLCLLDLDGVVVNYSQGIVEAYNQRYETKIDIADWKSFNFSESYGKEISNRIIEIHNEPGFFETLKPYPGAIEVVRELNKVCPIEVCSTPTKRFNEAGEKEINPECLKSKALWIHKYIKELSKTMTFTTIKHLCKADFLVDDALRNVVDWTRNHTGVKALLITQPWNQTKYLGKNIIRTTLADVPNYVKTILSENIEAKNNATI